MLFRSPPLNFDADEIEALVVGLSLLARTGDLGLQQAAARISTKIDVLRRDPGSLQSSTWGAGVPPVVDPATLRQPDQITDEFVNLASPGCTLNGECIILPTTS